MEKIKKLIIIVLIFILIIGLILFIVIKNRKSIDDKGYEKDESGNIIYDGGSEEMYSKAFKNVFDPTQYFVVKNIIENYYMNIQYIKSDIEFENLNEEGKEEAYKKYKEYGIQSLKNMIDQEYIKDYSVNDDFLENMVKKYNKSDNTIIFINDIKVAKLDDSKLIILTDFEINKVKEKALIKLDMNNSTFSIFLEDFIQQNNYTAEMNEKDITISKNDIQKNDYNTYSNVSVSDETMAREYLSIYRNMILSQDDRLYDVLTEEYKTKRFENKEEFLNYSKEMYQYVKGLILYKYKKENNSNGDSVFNLFDNYNNSYIVTVDKNNFLKFNFELDNYTIKTETFKEKYNNSSDEEKVYYDVQEFLSMINTKNYRAAFNKINATFRKNNFETLLKFEEIIKKQYYEINIIESIKSIEKNGNYFVCKLTLCNAEKTEEKVLTIIMNLLEDTDFEMSFSIE